MANVLKILGLTHFCNTISTRYVPYPKLEAAQGDGSFQWMGTRRISLFDFDVICLDSVDVGDVIVVVTGCHLLEVDAVVHLFVSEGDGLVDLDGLGELAVRLEVARLVRRVLENDVGLGVLVVPQANQDDVGLSDPHLFPQLPTDVAQTLNSVEAHSRQTTVTQHLGHLGVLLAVLTEHKLTLHSLIFVLSTAAILASLSLVLRHFDSLSLGVSLT